jgi:glyceraldehyde-3-phosphate dehydrogenase (NAD(P))
MHKNVVHVVGTGTIGEPLIGLLTNFRQPFGIDEITFHKRTPLVTDRSKVSTLVGHGAKLCVDRDNWRTFSDLGMAPCYEAEEAIERAKVVIDCTPAGNENKQRYYDRYATNGCGFIAQGSEFGFGRMYAHGINDKILERDDDRFVQVVSCNTHNLAAVIDTIALGSAGEDNLQEARFVCMRRANDLSEDGAFIPAPEAGKHDDPRFGTHQARDAHYLFKTRGLDLNIYSSALKLNTQYMHMIHFDLVLRRPTTLEDVIQRIDANPRIALTNKSSSASVFSFGRDHGLFGRILNQTVVVRQSLALKGDREVVGVCFTPQDGNSLLSSIAAALRFLDPGCYKRKVEVLRSCMFNEI